MAQITDERLAKILSETQETIMEHNARCARGSVEVNVRLFESLLMELQFRRKSAELEARTVTVKLASRRLPSDYVDGEFSNDDLAAIHNACRLECKVSVEKYLSAHGIVVKWEDE